MKGAAITASSLYFSRGAGTNRAGKLQRKEGAYYLDALLIYHYHYFLIIIYYLVNVRHYPWFLRARIHVGRV